MAEETTLRGWFPSTVTFDGREIQIEIKRLNIQEGQHFRRLLDRAARNEARRLVLVRKPGEEMERVTATALSEVGRQEAVAIVEELERRAAGASDAEDIAARPATAEDLLGALRALVDGLKPTDTFVLSDEEIEHRRWCDLDDTQRRKYDALKLADESAVETFLAEALSKYVRVKPGQLVLEEEVVDAEGNVTDTRRTKVLDGGALGRCYGARHNAIQQIALAVNRENRLSDEEKNGLRSRSTSAPISSVDGRDRQVTGISPEPTAANVASTASATSAAAMASSGASSGAAAGASTTSS